MIFKPILIVIIITWKGSSPTRPHIEILLNKMSWNCHGHEFYECLTALTATKNQKLLVLNTGGGGVLSQ